MSETNGNKGTGRKNGATEIATIDTKAECVRLFLSGLSVPQIAKQVNRSEVTVYTHLAETRLSLIKAKKDYFNERIALYLEDTLDAIASNGRLLSDSDFLRLAEPERIDAVSRAYGILSDKCFVLLAGIGVSKPRPEDSSTVAG